MGLPHERPLPKYRFFGTEREVEAELYRLQKGYCQDETPKVDHWYSQKHGKTFYEATSDSDYSYIARVVNVTENLIVERKS